MQQPHKIVAPDDCSYNEDLFDSLNKNWILKGS